MHAPFHLHWQWLSNSDGSGNSQISPQKSAALDCNRYALLMVQYLASNRACVPIIWIKYRHIATVFLLKTKIGITFKNREMSDQKRKSLNLNSVVFFQIVCLYEFLFTKNSACMCVYVFISAKQIQTPVVTTTSTNKIASNALKINLIARHTHTQSKFFFSKNKSKHQTFAC